jgi:hypothetical protein
MEQCEACGCKEKASMTLVQTVGKKQRLNMCEKHRPTWSRDAVKVAANKFYLVEELN